MKKRWIKLCEQLSAMPADFYAHCRKILRSESVTFPHSGWRDDLELSDIGYTTNKINRLIKDYKHIESHNKAIELWDHFIKRGSYSSASFTTYNHLVKAGATSPSEKIETRGPCLQSVVITLIPEAKGKRKTTIDIFYRTTEFFKKFPADLLLIQHLIEPFDFSTAPIENVNMHFAGITLHPMYSIVPAALSDDPVDFFEKIKKSDIKFFRECVSWNHKYLVTSRGITKFSQAIATQTKAIESLKKNGNMHLVDYIKDEYKPKR